MMQFTYRVSGNSFSPITGVLPTQLVFDLGRFMMRRHTWHMYRLGFNIETAFDRRTFDVRDIFDLDYFGHELFDRISTFSEPHEFYVVIRVVSYARSFCVVHTCTVAAFNLHSCIICICCSRLRSCLPSSVLLRSWDRYIGPPTFLCISRRCSYHPAIPGVDRRPHCRTRTISLRLQASASTSKLLVADSEKNSRT